MADKQCPWCAETIRAEAIKCRYCGSRVDSAPDRLDGWHRDYPDRKMAGVCSAIAHNLGTPLLAVRVLFTLLAFFDLFGVLAYLALWFLIPREPEGESGLDRSLDTFHSVTDGVFGARRRDDERPSVPERRGSREDWLDSD